MVSFVGDVDPGHNPASNPSGSRINDTHTTTIDTAAVYCVVGMEGNENPATTDPCLFNSTTVPLLYDTGSTGSNTDVRILVYRLLSPAVVTDANTRFDIQFSGAPFFAIWFNVEGSSSSNLLDTTLNNSGTSSTVLSSGGASGSGLLAICVGQGSDMNPSSVSDDFLELLEGETAATTSDFSYNIAYNLNDAPSGVTCTWDTTDENAGILIELLPDVMGSTPELTGFDITMGLGTVATDTPSLTTEITGFGITMGLGTVTPGTGQPGSAGTFGILIEGTTDKLLQENGDIILLEASQQPEVIFVTGFLRQIQRSSVLNTSTKTTITRTVRLVSDVSNLITIQSGDNLDIVYNIVDEDRNAVDITGGSITWNVLRSGTDTTVFTKSSPSSGVELTTPAAGTITVTINPADTTSLDGTYTLDGEYIASGGEIYTFEDGGLRVK